MSTQIAPVRSRPAEPLNAAEQRTFYAEQGYVTGSSVQIEKWIDPSKRGDRGQ